MNRPKFYIILTFDAKIDFFYFSDVPHWHALCRLISYCFAMTFVNYGITEPKICLEIARTAYFQYGMGSIFVFIMSIIPPFAFYNRIQLPNARVITHVPFKFQIIYVITLYLLTMFVHSLPFLIAGIRVDYLFLCLGRLGISSLLCYMYLNYVTPQSLGNLYRQIGIALFVIMWLLAFLYFDVNFS